MNPSKPRDPLVERIVRETLERLRRRKNQALVEFLEQNPAVFDEVRTSITEALRCDGRPRDAIPASGSATEMATGMSPMSGVADVPSTDSGPLDRAGEPAAESAIASSPRPKPPTQLGDFRIIREVGRGGMGVVYEAEQISLGRHVALKVLPENLIRDARFRRRFEREARAAGRLHHTNIVPVYGVGEHEGTPYYVMQFIEGMGLDKVLGELKRFKSKVATPPAPTLEADSGTRAANLAQSLLTNAFVEGTSGNAQPPKSNAPTEIAQKKLTLGSQSASASAAQAPGDSSKSPDSFTISSPSQHLVAAASGRRGGRHYTYWQGVARIGVQLAEALDHAHRLGVWHRDIKPSNLLLDTQGTIWMTDFGLAKADDLENLTSTGDILGTLRYMPPEALKGQFTARSDIYALGLTLYEMVALRPAFAERDKGRLLQQVSSEPVSELGKLADGVPRDLETIIHKAIDRDPEHRYATASDLAEDLQRFLDDEPIRARRLSTWEKLNRWRRRNRAVAALTGAIATLLVVGLVTALFFAGHYFRLAAKEAAARRQADDRLSDNYTFSGLVAGDQGNAQQAVLWFANAAAQSSDAQRLRSSALRFQSWSDGLAKPVFAHWFRGEDVLRAEFHPSGRYLLTLSYASGCTIFDLSTGQSLELPAQLSESIATTWDPTGKWIVGGSGAAVVSYRFPSLELGPTMVLPEKLSALDFSRDGNRLAIAFDQEAWVWDWKTDGHPIALASHPEKLTHLRWSNNGAYLATRCEPGDARVFSLTSETDQEPVLGPVACRGTWDVDPGGMVFIDDDRGFITITGAGEWTWWSLDSKTPRRTVATSGSIHRILPGRDGKTFVVCLNPVAQIWDIKDEKPLASSPRCLNYFVDVAYAPDGRSILTVGLDKIARFWSVATGAPLSAPIPHQDEIDHAAIAPDGVHFATVQKDGLVRVWAVQQGARERTIPLGIDESFVSLSHDGAQLVPAGWNHRRHQRSTRAYDIRSGRPVGPLLQCEGLINGAVFAPNNRDVLMLSSSPAYASQHDRSTMHLGKQPGVVQLWDSQTGQQLWAPIVTNAEPIGAAFRPDGAYAVVVCYDGSILMIDTRQGRIMREESAGHSGLAGYLTTDWVRFDRMGNRFATWGLGPNVDLWNGATGAREHTIRLKERAHNVIFSADGRLLFTMGSDNTAASWSTETAKPVGPALEHGDWVFTACLSPDGRSLLTACRDRSAGLWDWSTGRRLQPGLPHDHEVLDVAFTPDGRWMFTASKDGSVQSWDAQTGLAIGPKYRVPGGSGRDRPNANQYPEQIEVTPDGKTLIVAGIVGEIVLIPLDLYVTPRPVKIEEMLAMSELLSGQSLHEAGGVVNLTTPEWMSRWNAYRARFAERPPAIASASLGQ